MSVDVFWPEKMVVQVEVLAIEAYSMLLLRKSDSLLRRIWIAIYMLMIRIIFLL